MKVAHLGFSILLLATLVAAQTLPATKSPFSFGPQTTIISSPRLEWGAPDYVTAWNQTSGQNVTPENNAFIAWLNIVGTGKNIIAPTYQPQILKLCGARETPQNARLLIDYVDVVEQRDHLSHDAAYDKATAAMRKAARSLWHENDDPELAAYLKAQKPFLDQMAAIAQQPHWWIPKATAKEGQPVALAALPALSPIRNACSALCARAILRASDGDWEGCVSDILTARQIGCHVGSGKTIIERLVGLAIRGETIHALAAIAASGILPADPCNRFVDLMAHEPLSPQVADAIDAGERWSLLSIVTAIALEHTDDFQTKDGNDPYCALITRGFTFMVREKVDWDVILKTINQNIDEAVAAGREPDVRKSVRLLDAYMAKFEAMKTQVSADLQKHGGVPVYLAESRDDYSSRIATIMISALLPDYVSSQKVEIRFHTEQKLVSALLVLAQFKAKTGAWPEKLEILPKSILDTIPPDPLSDFGRPRYVLTPRGPVVYSVGFNGVDDGGIYDPDHAKDDWALGITTDLKP